MAMSKQEKNSAVVNALNHPLRRELLRRMAKYGSDGVSPKKLADEFGGDISLQLIAYHVRLLAEPGIVKLVKTAPRRGAVEHFYKRSGSPLDVLAQKVLDLLGKE